MRSDPGLNRLAFLHPMGKIAFPVEWAMFCLEDDRFTCSLQCRETKESHGMAEPLFCLVDLAVPKGLREGLILRHETNVRATIKRRGREIMGFEGAHAHLYAGRHFDPYDVRMRLVELKRKAWEVELRFMTWDVRDYHPKTARDHAVVAHFRMKEGVREQMWIPA